MFVPFWLTIGYGELWAIADSYMESSLFCDCVYMYYENDSLFGCSVMGIFLSSMPDYRSFKGGLLYALKIL